MKMCFFSKWAFLELYNYASKLGGWHRYNITAYKNYVYYV